MEDANLYANTHVLLSELTWNLNKIKLETENVLKIYWQPPTDQSNRSVVSGAALYTSLQPVSPLVTASSLLQPLLHLLENALFPSYRWLPVSLSACCGNVCLLLDIMEPEACIVKRGCEGDSPLSGIYHDRNLCCSPLIWNITCFRAHYVPDKRSASTK